MSRWKELPADLDANVCRLVVGLRRLKDHDGLSMRRLAAKTGYSAKSWERYLGGRSLPPRAAVEALARVVGENPARLLALHEVAAEAWKTGRGATRAPEPAPATPPEALPQAADTPATEPDHRHGLDSADRADPDHASPDRASPGSADSDRPACDHTLDDRADPADPADRRDPAAPNLPAPPPPASAGPTSTRHRRRTRHLLLLAAALLVPAVAITVHAVLRQTGADDGAKASATRSAPAYTCRIERTDGHWYAGNSRTHDAILAYGLAGPDVAEAQCLLHRAGFPPGEIDGIYGPLTQRAVKRAQQRAGLVVDGIVGPHTWQALRQ